MPDPVERRTASSGAVDYGVPVELHDTTASRIEFIPFYVRRTEGEEFTFKLVRTDKRAGWTTTTINVPGPATRRFHRALTDHLAITDQEPGQYVVVRSDGGVDLNGVSAEMVAAAVDQLLNSNPDVIGHLVHHDLGAELLHALRTSMRLKELRDAVAALTTHLREGETAEATYQGWCEQHSWAFGNAYVVNDQLRSVSAADQIDLLLPRHLGGFRDLIELKRPDMAVLRWDDSHRNWYWSAEASKAIGQCHRYLDVLHSEVGDGGLRDSPEVVAYHPRATIVIGRSEDWGHEQQKALHGLNRRLSDISVITYDHLLAQARRTLELVEAPDDEVEVIVPAEDGWDDW